MLAIRDALPRLLICIAVTLPAQAWAMKARIGVFEGIVRAAPKADAAVLERLPEGREVSVDEVGQDGWRRIRTSDGKVGWIPESMLAGLAPEVAPPTAPAPPEVTPAIAPPVPATPSLRTVRLWQANLYAAARGSSALDVLAKDTVVTPTGSSDGDMLEVRLADGRVGWMHADALSDAAPSTTPPVAPTPAPELSAPRSIAMPRAYYDEPPRTVMVVQSRRLTSFGKLSDATRGDSVVWARASALDDRDDTGLIVFWSSGLASVLCMGLSLAAMPSGDYDTDFSATYTLLGVGAVLSLGMLVGWAIRPGDDDALEVTNDWNSRHPDEPIEWVVKPVTNVYIPASTYQPSRPTYSPYR
ncbi:MAG: SH3 domain-containing protein [Myxococcota bacterium]